MLSKSEIAELALKHLRTDGEFEQFARAIEAAALRAQADAKPVAWLHRQGDHTEVSERRLDDDEISRGWTQEPLYSRPASEAAQALSDANAILAKYFKDDPANAVRAHAAVIEILTHASAATVAETSKGGTPDTYPARLLNESDASLAERVDSWHKRNPQAAQQQAEPVGEELLAEIDHCLLNAATDRRIYQALEKARDALAAQSGQREGDLPVIHLVRQGGQASSVHVHAVQRDAETGAIHILVSTPDERAGAAEGHVLVPVDPTKAMLNAAERLNWASDDIRGNCCNLWNAMIAAAPTPAAQGGV